MLPGSFAVPNGTARRAPQLLCKSMHLEAQ
jgi:hypothetical protein